MTFIVGTVMYISVFKPQGLEKHWYCVLPAYLGSYWCSLVLATLGWLVKKRVVRYRREKEVKDEWTEWSGEIVWIGWQDGKCDCLRRRKKALLV